MIEKWKVNLKWFSEWELFSFVVTETANFYQPNEEKRENWLDYFSKYVFFRPRTFPFLRKSRF